MKIFFLTISLIVTFQFIFSYNYHTKVENINKNNNTKRVELCIDSIHPNSQLSTKFLEVFKKCQKIPTGVQLVTIDQMHSTWKEYINIPSPNYFEYDLNGDKIIDFVFILMDTNLIQSSLCCLLSENDLYKFYIIDSAATYENKNQIIIFPENSGLLKTEYETYKLKNGGINSIFLWESLEFTYYWTGNNFEIIMFD